VRDVVDRSGYRPFEGRRRVVIIDDAEALVPQAQNALLKVLEEPPSASVFILVSAIPDALLPTVLSRCPRLPFAPLPAAAVASVLVRDHGYTDTEAHVAAADADGSIGRALESRSVDVAAARDIARGLLERIARGVDPVRRMEAARELTAIKGGSAAERDQLAVCLRIVASLLRDVRILAAGGEARTLANPDLQTELGRLATVFSDERGTKAFAAVDEALVALERNASPKVVADWLVLHI
jgi:DNA polymerase-3 subunit delta'